MRCNHAIVLLCLGSALLPSSAASGEKPAITASKAWPAAVRAHYRLSYNGFDVGRIKFNSTVANGSYSLASSGKISVLFGAFSWSGASSVSGAIDDGTPSPEIYSFAWRGQDKGRTVKMGYQDKVAKDIAVKPQPRVKPDTVPLKPADKANALDPMSALLMLTRADGRQPCDRKVGIFDGKHRYNIVLSPKRRVRLRPTSQGGRPEIAHVCRVVYEPVAGHRDNEDTKAFASNRNAELVLRRIPGSDMMIPHSVTVPTAWGTGSMVAERIDVTTADAGKIALTN